MEFYSWLNEALGQYDCLLKATKSELSLFREHFKVNDLIAATWDGEEFYFFLDTKSKILTPMNSLSFAFGYQYEGDPPYGGPMFVDFDVMEYKLIRQTAFDTNIDTRLESEQYREKLRLSNIDNFPLGRAYSFKLSKM